MLTRARFALVCALGFGCSNADFQVAPDASTPIDSAVDVVVPDGCTVNGCGGCTVLAVKPGDACGVCGKYICDSLESLQCDDPGKNLCGGCGKLAGAFGGKCGDCGRYACKEGGTDLECVNPSKNACGGCETLPGAPGDTCGGGSCGTGKFVCNGLDTLDCSGVPTANKCGGCGTLAGVPGDACGSCGIWECAPDKSSVKCKEGTPVVGTSCGMCGTSTYACATAPTTSCSKLDDRTLGIDLDYAKTDGPMAPIFDHSHDYAIGWTARHTGRVQTLKVTMSRDTYRCPSSSIVTSDGGTLESGLSDASVSCSSADPYCKCTVTTGGCSCTGTLGDGFVYVYLYKGVPGVGTLTYIGAASFAPTTVPLGTSGTVSLTLPSTLPGVNKGDPLFFWFLHTGTNWRFSFFGGSGSDTDPDLTEYTKTNYPYSPWSATPSKKEQPQTTVQMFGCF